MIKKTFFVAAAVLAAGIGFSASAVANNNPVDRVSNPDALDYSDVHISPQDMKAPFVRDGVIVEPQHFATIKPGLALPQVHTMLGEPSRKHGAHGREWDYNFKFRLPQSQNFLVCQYKVEFDSQQFVLNTTWRRRQCQQLADGELAAQ